MVDKEYMVTVEGMVEVYRILATTPEEAVEAARCFLDDIQSTNLDIAFWSDSFNASEVTEEG